MEFSQKIKTNVNRYLHFWELPTQCRFWLSSQFWGEIYFYKNKNFKSWKEFSQQLGINYGTLRNYLAQKNNSKKAQFTPISTLIKISSLSNTSLKETEKHIQLAKCGSNGKSINLKFPINLLAKEWAGLVGALLSEGSISRNHEIQFWNKDKEVIDKFKNLTEQIVPGAVYSAKYKNAYYCNLPRLVAHILISGLKFHTGAKVTANPGIPKLYMDLNPSVKENRMVIGNLLSWLFTGDGWISLFKDHLGKTQRHMGIGFSVLSKTKTAQLLEDTHNIIKRFGINPQKIHFSRKTVYFKGDKKYITNSWKFFIHGKANFTSFQQHINFQDTRRREILKEAIESFVKPNLRKGEPIVKIVNAVIKHAPCTKHRVSKDTGLQTKRIEILLKKAKDNGFVRVIGGGEKVEQYGRKPYIYEHTIDGIEFIKEKGGKFL